MKTPTDGQLRNQDLNLSAQPLKDGESHATITVNGIEIAWDSQAGYWTFRGLPVAMMSVDSTLAGLMSGVESMVGPERFALALQSVGRLSVESDWKLISSFSDFREGFAALELNAAIAGWGKWELVNYDLKNQQGIFRVYNNWEGLYQKALGVCWGSGMLAGKLAGICSKSFSTNCWATQTAFVAKGDAYDEFIVAPSSRQVEQEIEKLLVSDQATSADMAVALRKLQQTEKILRTREQQLRQGNAILEQRVAERTQELRIAAAAFESMEGMMITDSEGCILRVNNAFCQMTGYSADQAVGLKPALLKTERHDSAFYRYLWKALLRDKYWQGEIWNRRKNGGEYPAWYTITPVVGETGRATNYIAVFSDITEQKNAKVQIHKLAFYDSLTGLPNRRLMLDRLQHVLATSSRNGQFGAVLFIDIDNFRTVNNTLGHNAGDQLVIDVAQRLLACLRENDTVARLGGDEFVIILENLSDKEQSAALQVEAVNEKILHSFNRPFVLQAQELRSTASIGVCLFRYNGITVEELLKRADTAMYQAKRSGRNTARFYDPAMQIILETRATMEVELYRALSDHQLKLYYQVQVNNDRTIFGAEVLLRWQHPQRGLMRPEHFISLAEDTGLIMPMGRWVLETACTQLKAWEAVSQTHNLSLAVNVSPRQFRQEGFVDEVHKVLKATGADPSHLKLELTESVILDNLQDTIYKIRELKSIGVQFSLDDFGTGYSSLSYLQRLPIDQLKIDQSFVHDIASNPDDAVIVQTIIGMANNLGLEVIAEGVETEAQMEFLVEHGCNAFQGYLHSRPLPLKNFNQLLH